MTDRGACHICRPRVDTVRARQVMTLIALCCSRKQIAAEIGISLKRVDRIAVELKRKLNADTDVGLARYAVEHGLVRWNMERNQ